LIKGGDKKMNIESNRGVNPRVERELQKTPNRASIHRVFDQFMVEADPINVEVLGRVNLPPEGLSGNVRGYIFVPLTRTLER
jgi:hypothetical protein